MRKFFSVVITISIFCIAVKSQIVSNNAFLKGNFVEVGVSPCGSFGSTVCAPSGYHARGQGISSSACQLGFISNPQKDNWTNYVGDYFLPGSPEEGWGLTIDGTNYNNNLICGVNGIPGAIINYNSTSSQSSTTWQGAVAGLSITARTYIPINSIYFVTEVTVVNTSANTINNVYYMRNVDPDHGVLTPGAGGLNVTNNTIAQQTPNTCNQSLVSATTTSGSFYIGLGSIDSRARVSMGGFANRSALAIYSAPGSGSGLVSSGSRTADEAISIAFNLGNLSPNQSTKFAYTYILDATQLDDALAATNINLNINGVSYNTGSAVDICSNAPVPIIITNPGGFTNWSWSPATGLNTTTGTIVSATLTGPITYTATGTGSCGNVSIDVTLNPQNLTPPGNATGITAPSVLSFGQTGVVLSTPPVTNATSYFWELPPGTVVTSASNSTNTITISLSNTSWCGKIKVYPINACASGAPSTKDVCITNLYTGNVRTNICAGDTLNIPYTIAGGGVFVPGNVFTAQLSDSVGSFDNPVSIGSLSTTVAASIIGTIPANVFPSNLYRVRVVSSIPSTSGADNGADITINVTHPSIYVSSTKRMLCAGSGATFTATISGGGSSPIYQWRKNGSNVGSNISSYTDSFLLNGDIINCALTSNALCVLPVTVISNNYYINIAPTPVVSLVGSTCSGNTITLTSSVSPNKIQVFKNGVLSSTVISSFAATATTKAGGNGFGSSANQLASPSSVFVDDNGVVYVADKYNHRVQKYSTASTIGVTVAGGTGSGSSLNQLGTPTAVFVDKAGAIYVAESGNNRVTKWTTGSTTGVVVAGGNGNGSAANQLNGPHTIFVDNAQNVYVSDQYNNRVQKWAYGATAGVTVAGGNGSGAASNQLNLPQGIYVDNDYNLYIADQGNNRIQRWAFGANVGTTVAGGNSSGSAANQLSFPTGVFVDINSNVYITDYFNARVQKWTVGSAVGVTVAGGNGSGASLNQLSGPVSLTIAKDGNLYVVDDFNNRVQKFAYAIATSLNATQVGTYTVTVSSANNCTATTLPLTVLKSRTPIINVVASQSTLCTGSPTIVLFTATATNTGSAPIYQWKKNGVNVGTGALTYTDATLANKDSVWCVLTSNDTCVTAATVNSNKVKISINATVTPSVTIASVLSALCSGASFDFIATPTNGGTNPTYQWSVNSTPTGTNSPNFSSSTLVNGDIISCFLTSNAVCNTGSATSNTINVVITPTVTPSVSIAASQNDICNGTNVVFTATPTNGGTIPTYQWKKNGVNIGTGVTYTSNILANNDTITCELTSNIACSVGVAVSNSIVMVVNNNVIPQIAITTPLISICDGTNITFNATVVNGGAAPTYQWKKNGLDVGDNDTTYSDNALVDGDQISCLLNSNASCLTFSNEVSNVITVTVSPILVPSVSIAASQSNICGGASVIFTATPTNGGANPQYQWNKNGLNVSNNNPVYTTTGLVDGDSINCILTSNAVCSTPATTISNFVKIAVIPTVTPTISISASATNICSGVAIKFTALSTNGGPAPSYQWYVNGSPAGTDSTTFTTNKLTTGSVVNCVLTSNARCTTSNTATSNNIVITVGAIVTPFVSISSSNPILCATTTSVSFFASISGGGTSPVYQWRRNGVIVGTNSSSYTRASWVNGDSITCTLVSNAVCKTASSYISSAIYVKVNTPVTPTINITTPTTTVCSGVPVTFTANTTNAGTAPIYTWRINGSSFLTTATNTFTTTTLSSGNIVTCLLTSNATCATPASVVSAGKTMTVIATVTPTISIATPQTAICGGSTITFLATATNGGSSPIYQWQKNGTNVGSNSTTYTDNVLATGDIISCNFISNATCATVTSLTSNILNVTVTTVNPPTVTTPLSIVCGNPVMLTALGGISDSVRWFTTSTVGTSFATAFNTNVSPTVTTTYYAESYNAGSGGTPKVTTLNTTGGMVIDHNSITGDDRGGLALSTNYVYIVGDNFTGRFNKTDLTGGIALPLRDGFFSDLSTGTLWQFGNASTAGGTFNNGVITTLYQLDENLTLSGVSLNLSHSINVGGASIVGAGFGFVVISSGGNSYKISLANGYVLDLPFVGSISATASESWASYGWSEFDGTDFYLCYVQTSTQIVKQNLTTGAISALQTFTNLSDMAAIAFDAVGNRMYFHHEGGSQFGGTSETLGFIGLSKATPSASCVSTRVPVVVNVSYNTPTISIAASQSTICAGNLATFTANTTFAGSSPMYQWQINGNNVGTNSSTYSDNTLNDGDVVTCTLTSSANCLTTNIVSSNIITMTIDAVVVPSVIIDASQTPACPGAIITFTATPNNGGTAPIFVWRKNGIVVGSNSPTYSTNTLAAGNTIACSITSNALCTSVTIANSNTISISFATPLSASVNIVASSATVCPNSLITYTAIPNNGGTNPIYQWQVNGVNVGININTYSSNTLVDGDIVTCNMVSNSTACLAASSVYSNAITVNIYSNSLIKTIAGNGSATYSGDGGAATSASINQPFGMVRDASGNIYFSDFANNRVRKINSSGTITTIAGNGVASSIGDGGLATSASVNGPAGLAKDAVGNIYIAEYYGNKIRKINISTGIITTVVGTGIAGFLGDGASAISARINGPVGIAFNNTGLLFICDALNNRVRRALIGGTISTFVGNGTSASSGDAGLATAASVYYPAGIAFDASNNLYVSEYYRHKIRKINTSNIISTIAGNGTQSFGGDDGPATAAFLNNPYGLAFDASGNLLIADAGNNRVRKISSSGIITTYAGTSFSGFNGDNIAPTAASLSFPTMIYVDASNNLYISDYSNARIRKVTPNTASTTVPTISASPIAVCFGGSATLTITAGALNGATNWKWYSGNCGGSLIGTGTSVTVSPTTQTSYYARGEGGCADATATVCGTIAVGITGVTPTISVAASQTIICPPATVNFTTSITNGGASPTYQWKKNGLNVGSTSSSYSTSNISSGDIFSCVLTSNLSGCLSINNVVSNYVTIYNAGGTAVSTFAGNGSVTNTGDGGIATAAGVANPLYMGRDYNGNIYVVNYFANTVRKIDIAGIITTFAGTGTAGSTGDGGFATAAQLNNIGGVTADIAGNIYITETTGAKIRKVSPSGIISTIVGTGISGFNGDGGSATAAQINSPLSVALDNLGNLYFVDYGNSRIRKVNASGLISTIAGGGGSSGDGILATSAFLNSPRQIFIDINGDLLFTEGGTNKVRKINATTNIISTIAGTGTGAFGGDGGLATAAFLNYPIGIAGDKAGNIFISDYNNNRVRMINTAGIISTVLGNGSTGYNGDGLSPTATTLTNPFDLISDDMGIVYFADYGNNRVRKLVPSLGLPTIGSVTSNASNVCAGTTVTLTVTGSLNAASDWKWYSGSCGGALVGTGASITVNPTVSTNYFVRGEAGCLTSVATCTSITVYVTPPIVPIISLSASKTNICVGDVDSFKATVTGAGTCYPGWSYRKPITINNSNPTVLTDFQVKLSLNTASLITSGKMLATGNDIRFSDSTCAKLFYYVQDSINNISTNIWVRVNSIPANSSKTIYLYYGNPVALSESNPDSTFLLFDDFKGSSLDATKWNSFGNAPVVSVGSITFTTTTASTVRSVKILPKPYITEIKVDASSGQWPSMGQLNKYTFAGVGMFQQTGSNTHINSFVASGTSYSSYFSSDIYGGNVGVWSMYWLTQNNFTASWLGNTITKTTSQNSDIPTDSLHSTFGLLNAGTSSMTIDWFRARKYAAITPTYSVLTEALNAYNSTYNFLVNNVSVQNTLSNVFVSSSINNNDTLVCLIDPLNSCSIPTPSNKIIMKVVVPKTVLANVNGCNTVVYKGTTYTASTILRDTIKSILGCDSIYNSTDININIIPTTSIITTVNGCNSVVYKGTTYLSSISLKDTLKSYQGCDSIYKTVVIMINTVTPTNTNKTITGCKTIVYNGVTYTTSTTLKDTIKSYQGCDSVYNVVNIVINSLPATNNSIIISGCDSVVYFAISYKTTTTLRDTIRTYQGCDSIYNTVQINVTPTPTIATLTYNNVVYLGDTIKLNVVTSNAVGYSWTGPVSFASIIQNPTIANVIMSNAGYYVVVASNGACSKTDSVNVSINNTNIYSIEGRIITPINKSISNAQLILSGFSNDTSTSVAGDYKFKHLAYGDYSIKVKKNNDIKKNNGVSGIDLILITNHILNKARFTNPYKLIAADANGNKGISNIDLIYLKRLILAIDTSLPLNRLWTFVDSAYVFADTTNPFPFRDSINVANLSSIEKSKTFIGVRLGDVNYDWNVTFGRSTTKPVELIYLISDVECCISNSQNQSAIRNKTLEIPISVKNFKQLVTAQYTLNFNNKDFDFVGIENNKLSIDFNARHAEDGKLSFLWADAKGEEKSLEDGTEIFTLLLKSKSEIVNGELENKNLKLAISNDITEIEAWDQYYQQHSIILTKKESIKAKNLNEHFSVSPNPTSGEVVILLTSNSNKKIVFKLTDVAGKTLHIQGVEAIKGNNTYQLNLKKKSHVPSALYFLKANGLEGEDVKRIVITGE